MTPAEALPKSCRCASGDLHTRDGVRVNLYFEMLWRGNRPVLMAFGFVAITCLLLVAQPRGR